MEIRVIVMKKLFTFFLNRQFVIFVLIGVFNTLSGSLFATVYSLALNANIAFVCGYITSLIIAFFLNSKLNFRKKISLRRFIKFIVSYIPNFIIQNLIVIIFYNNLEWNKIITYFLAAIIGVPVTFVFMKLFAFGK